MESKHIPLAIFILVMAVGLPFGLIYFFNPVGGDGELQGGSGGGGDRKVWLSTPAFTLPVDGKTETLVAALKMNNNQDAVRVCEYMPLVRDRINTMAEDVLKKSAKNEDTVMSLERRRLATILTDLLNPTGPSTVKILDARTPPTTVLTDAPSVICDGRVLDPTKSPLFTGN